LSNQNKEKLKTIFLVHGELKRQERLKDGLIENGFSQIEIPILEQEFKL
jgi:metallo-beta-lactamase family protein